MHAAELATSGGDESIVDVIVVGAGLSGLIAATRLVECGRTVRVVEARDRVGGRTLSQTLAGDVVDLGGQWLGARQPRLAGLAAELGVATFPQHHAGDKLLSWGGRMQRYAGELPRLSLWAQLELAWTDRRWRRLMTQIDPRQPWRMPDAARWDSMTLETWKRRHLRSAGARLFVDIITRAVTTSEPRDISFLYFLAYLRWGQGLESLISIAGGAQQDRFIGGAQQISTLLAQRLPHRVELDAPVRAIEQHADRVVVRTDRAVWVGRRVIVAVPPLLAGRIDYSSRLPERRNQLTQRMPMGSVIKYVAAYDRPFWREAGLSGEAFSDSGPTVTTFDDCSHDGRHPALVTFSDGQAARDWGDEPPEHRRQAVLGELARFFGPQALRPLDFAEKNWNADPWSAGCYAGVTGPGTLISFGSALAEPCGRIHWAGTETATEWMGYLEGAIQAGHRAADETVARGV